MKFIGREKELQALETLYRQERFQLFILYGRRRVGKTTFLNEFCRNRDSIFYAAEQSSDHRNLEKFSACVFAHYGETGLSAFSSWTDALSWIDARQGSRRLVLVLDEFPYLVQKNRALLSELQHLIDHRLQNGRLFLILCGSYMGFMEKEVLGAKSPLFGRRTGQLQMKPFDYHTSLQFLQGFSPVEQLQLYSAFGGTPMYLAQVQAGRSFADNIRTSFLQVTSYLYEEPLLLLRQEVQEPGLYNAIIEAIAGGASRSAEIATKIGEESAVCLKYIRTLCELGLVFRETPWGEKPSSRRSIYGICDPMFRFWYRYVFGSRALIETGAADAVWEKRIAPDLNRYMGLAFERICLEYLQAQNAAGALPLLCTSIGRWWGTDPATRRQTEIDLVAGDQTAYLFCECKWRNEPADLPVLHALRQKADIFRADRADSWYILFSKSGFTPRLQAAADSRVLLVDLPDLMR